MEGVINKWAGKFIYFFLNNDPRVVMFEGMAERGSHKNNKYVAVKKEDVVVAE